MAAITGAVIAAAGTAASISAQQKSAKAAKTAEAIPQQAIDPLQRFADYGRPEMKGLQRALSWPIGLSLIIGLLVLG